LTVSTGNLYSESYI